MLNILRAIKDDRPILIYTCIGIMFILQMTSGLNILPKNIDPVILSLIFIITIGIFVQIVIFKYQIEASFVVGSIFGIAFLMTIMLFFMNTSAIKIDAHLWIAFNLLSFIVLIPVFHYIIQIADEVFDDDREQTEV